MSKNLLKEAKEFYRKMKSVYEAAQYYKSYRLNEYWAHQNMKDMLKIINSSETAEEVVHSAQKTWIFSVNVTDQIKNKAVDWLIENQKKSGIDIFSMDEDVCESRFSYPENTVLRNGRKITPDFLRTVSMASEIKRYCQPIESKFSIVELGARLGRLACTLSSLSKFSIIELGGGLGHLARTLSSFVPYSSYVMVDLPESLFFSYIFLRLNFPQAKALYVTSEQQLNDSSFKEYKYIFIPTMYAEAASNYKFDLFINTASLGEMKNDVIQYWMDFIQKKLNVKYLFTLNRYLNTIVPGLYNWRLEENQCSVLYDQNWEIINWELEPSFTRCPYVDTVIARYVEIVAKRIPKISVAEAKDKSRQLMLEVMQEDWVRLEDTVLPETSYRDNILVNDMTMSGTLFKLWESIRLDANESNVALMLKYIESLLRSPDREFEETFYYENLFQKLFKSKNRNDLAEINNIIELKREYRNSFPATPPSYAKTIKIRNTASILPSLIIENYKGFNIIWYGSKLGQKFYTLIQGLKIDLTQIDENTLEGYVKEGKCCIADSVYDAKALVDQIVERRGLKLMEEGYYGYNIVRYNNKFYALAQGLEGIDFYDPDVEAHIQKFSDNYRCFIGSSLSEVRSFVEKQIGRQGR
jgi:hypothetical protein